MQDKTSILAATTPQDNSTYHAFLIEVRDPDTGKRIFNVVNLVEVCKACRRSAKPWKCTHMSDRISTVKSEAARRQTMLFYRAGQKHVAQRELMGQSATNSGSVLHEDWIQAFGASSIPLVTQPRCIYLAIDPGGGGPGELGIIAMVETASREGTRLAVSKKTFFYCTFCGAEGGSGGRSMR